MSDSIDLSLTGIPTGPHRLEYYAVDRTNNISSGSLSFLIESLRTKEYKGINIHIRELTRRQNGNFAFRPTQPSINDILTEIKEMGLNAIRLNTFWETHRYYKSVNNEVEYINKIKEVAETADRLGIAVIYNVMHQWNISSWIIPSSGSGRGAGFPYECLQALNIPQGARFNTPLVAGNIETTPYNIFWKNFVYNYQCTIDGVTKGIWEHSWEDHFKTIVEITKDHPSTSAYQIINEPLYIDNGTIEIIEKLGDYYKYIADKIRSLTYKRIMFSEYIRPSVSDWGKYGSRDGALVALIPNVSNIAFTYHVYANQGFTDMYKTKANNIERVMSNKGIPIVITEFNNDITAGEMTEQGMINYLQEFKARGYGWFYYTYDPNYHSSIKDVDYNDRWNSAGTMTFKQMLINALNYYR